MASIGFHMASACIADYAVGSQDGHGIVPILHLSDSSTPDSLGLGMPEDIAAAPRLP
jgi:hypothetical protein